MIESYRIEVESSASMKFAVVVFPGSNCDHDAYHAASTCSARTPSSSGTRTPSLKGADVVILPGGFAHGDYLRTGAIARFSPIMEAVTAFAERGGPVLGICNGFQVLLEAGLLPGAMLRNRGLKFRCEHVHVRVEQTDTPFTRAARRARCCACRSRTAKATTSPTPDVLAALEAKRQVVFRYADADGRVDRRRRTRTARSTTSPASATKRATSSA